MASRIHVISRNLYHYGSAIMVLLLWFYHYGSTTMVLPLWFCHYGRELLESTFSWNPRSSGVRVLLESMFFQRPKKREPETPPPWRSVFACFHDVAGTASLWGGCAQAHAHRPMRTGSCSSRIHVLLEAMFFRNPCPSGIHVLLEPMFFQHPKQKEPGTPLGAAFLLVFTVLPALPVVGVHAHRLMRTGSCAQAHALLESMFFWNPRSSGVHVLLESTFFRNPCSSGIHVLLAP